ncbi:9805_t:CDS:2 [Diversispora eburnea]|uniref:9805_t:CDS:1 n=1 Tax=Diversispora eburnea TaxID=1213867 RepID=A0A9N8YV85_9GLOM|nr:9805_t:CDS:2 [Diversispora eburnea]
MSLRSVKKFIRKSASNLKELIGTKNEDNSNIPTSSTTLEISTSDNREYETSLHNTELLDDASELYDDVNDNTTIILDNVGSINDLYQPSSVIILDTMEVAEHNKRICGSLLDRVASAEAAVRNLKIRRDDNQSFFTEHNYLLFRKFLQTINKIKNFIHEISQLSRLGKYLRSASISETFQNLTNEFDGYMNSLHFSITIENHIQAEKDKKYLDVIKGGVTDFGNKISIIVEEVSALKNNFDKQSLSSINNQKPLRLDEIVTDDPLNIEDFQIVPNSNRGKKVHKRIRNHDGCEVAFKEVPVKDLPEYTKNSISVQVTILKKIQQSDEIIKFIGLHKNNDNLYLVMEWVEYGSLRKYYETYGMDNGMKVSIALEISRGLNFLASVQILHRDISTENILITLEKRAKITNFGLSRGFTDAT